MWTKRNTCNESYVGLDATDRGHVYAATTTPEAEQVCVRFMDGCCCADGYVYQVCADERLGERRNVTASRRTQATHNILHCPCIVIIVSFLLYRNVIVQVLVTSTSSSRQPRLGATLHHCYLYSILVHYPRLLKVAHLAEILKTSEQAVGQVIQILSFASVTIRGKADCVPLRRDRALEIT